jgi:Phosphorylase superfamily
MLHEKMVLCCGEDRTELLLALPPTESPRAFHEYRCYTFWRFESFTLVWSGIGTGCLEPLLYELLVKPPNSSRQQPQSRIQQIVLIGTAGAISQRSRREIGESYLIDKAYLGGAGVNVPEYDLGFFGPDQKVEPLMPRLGKMEGSSLEKRSIVSSDYYYGFSNDAESHKLRERDGHLRAAVKAAWELVDMVDMETAQFYYFCHTMGPKSLSFAAVRGIANSAENFPEQLSFSLQALRSALKMAFRLLSIEAVNR